MKKECEIVKDLLPSYVENLVSTETKQYIANHIEECIDCRQLFENMQEDNMIKSEQNIEEDQVEIRHIKKYKRKMTALKVFIISLIFIIILALTLFLISYIPKYSIILKAHNKIQDISNLTNYKFTISQYYTDSDTQNNYEYIDIYFYKDGKYKEELYSSSLAKTKIYYGDINSDKTIYIDNNTQAINELNSYQNKNKGAIFDVFSDIKYHSQNYLSLIGVDIRNDNYNGKECYVLKYGNDNTSYREIWIDKQTMLQIREVQEIFNSSYFERTFLIETNCVNDENVMVSQIGNFIN